MSILENMRQLKKQLLHQKHPFAQEELLFRQTYTIGYSMLLCVHGYPSEMMKDVLQKQLAMLDLPGDFSKHAIQTALKAEVEMIHTVLNALTEPTHKYLFMLDLYQLAQNDHKITEKEQELLVLFEELLQLNYAEIQFIRGFRLAMLRNDLELASKVVQAAFEQNVDVPLEHLSHFLPSFIYQEKWGQLTLGSGQKRQLSHATIVSGDIVVGKGAELDLNGMVVTFTENASIVVDGGVLKADRARLVATMDANKPLLSIRNVGDLKIANAHFYGANNVRAIEMNNAKVELDGCFFEKCFDEERGGAIYFTNSDYFALKHCIFENNTTLGKGGSVYIAGTEASHMKAREFFSRVGWNVQKVHFMMDGCQFRENRAEVAGAIYMYDVEVEMKNNLFESCSSTKGGGAIDMLNGELLATNNVFLKCKAAPQEAIVIAAGRVNSIDASQLGKFEQCDGKDLLIKS